nr:cytochrome c mitochondrial import factor cyc2 [Quercus suber]
MQFGDERQITVVVASSTLLLCCLPPMTAAVSPCGFNAELRSGSRGICLWQLRLNDTCSHNQSIQAMPVKAALLISAPSRIARNARANALTTASFSQTTAQSSEDQRAQVSIASQTSGTHDHHHGKRRPRKSGFTRRFAFFTIGVPLGYGLRYALSDDKNGSGSFRDFVRYTLVDKEFISPTSSIFTLKPATGIAIDVHDPQWDRAILSIEFKQPQLQIARQYTLLPPIPGQNPNELRFLIRKEQNGEVSGYLHRLPVGSDIELRGPSAELVLPDKVRSVLFLAGGTGIAPAMQIADTFNNEAKIHVLWANRHREDCAGGSSDTAPAKTGIGSSLSSLWRSQTPNSGTAASAGRAGPIVKHLDGLKSLDHSESTTMKVDYFVDEEGTFIRPADVADLIRRQRQSGPQSGPHDRWLIVSGPDGFIKYWAGSKQWKDGDEVQGPLGGVLSTLDLEGWNVAELPPAKATEMTATNDLGDRPACFKSTFEEVLFVLTATMAIATASLLTGSVTVTSSFIGRDLNMSTAEIAWLTSSCSLASGAFLLPFGKIADIWGESFFGPVRQ